MIVRIARITVAAADEDEVVSVLRAQAGDSSHPPGMLDLIFAVARAEPTAVEFVMISLWTDVDSVKRALGEAWDQPGGLAELERRLLHQRVEHLDVFADDWPEMVRFLGLAGESRRAFEIYFRAGLASERDDASS
jgi:quinol monooxygenase YgiN